MGKIAVVFGVKAVTYAIKHGLGVENPVSPKTGQIQDFSQEWAHTTQVS